MSHALRDAQGRFRKARNPRNPRPLHARTNVRTRNENPQRLFGKVAHANVHVCEDDPGDPDAEVKSLMRAPMYEHCADNGDRLAFSEREGTLVRGGRTSTRRIRANTNGIRIRNRK
jgi:hypothetical protein